MSTTTELQVPPEVRSTFRSRLFKPSRWRLWVQFALLGAFIIIIPILLTSSQLLQSSRKVLIDHEIIDLSDEANLRVNEMREDMSYLGRDIRIATGRHQIELPSVAVKNILTSVHLPDEPPMGDPQTVRDARRKYLSGCAAGVVAYRVKNDRSIEIAERTMAVESKVREEALIACLLDLHGRMNRPNAMDRSGFHLQPADGGFDARCILAFGSRDLPKLPNDLEYAYILDFSQYIRNRQRSSPRHFYFVTSPIGQLYIQPEPARVAYNSPIEQLVPWKYPTDEEGSWFVPLTDPQARQKRLANAVSHGGSRLNYVEARSLGYFYRKCYFPDNKPLEKLTTESQKAAQELNDLLRAEMVKDADLRCGELTPDFHYIEISHPNTARMIAISNIIEAWVMRHAKGKKPHFTTPLYCNTFQGQLTPLRVDLNDEDDPAWLVVAASIEELREDIDDRFDYIHRVWVYPTLLVSCILGIIVVMTLTRRLTRLVNAAEQLSDGKETHVPQGGAFEISQLAITLDDLSRRVQLRDRELRERAARYETILRAAGEGIVITSSQGIIEEANKAAGKMFGYRPEELIGQPVTRYVVHGTDPNASNDVNITVETLSSFTESRESVRGKRPNGTLFWIEINLRPVMLKDRTVIACIIRDITLRKEAEDRIKRMNDELEARVRVRTAELEETNAKLDVALKQAETASKAKDVFVANMSHELRQPLNIITGFTQVLMEEAGDVGAESILPDLNKILTAANHLLALINDILDLAKIAAGHMELNITTFDVAKLISDVHVLVAPLAEKNNNRFNLDVANDLGSMNADERRVRQILINLLSNAFKFTIRGSVTLKVRRVREEGRDWLRFQVADTGKGMSQEQLGRLFQRFYQADSSTTREQAGTGLGLAITQSFSEIMGGQPVHVTSTVDVGSEFTVTLPVDSTEKTLSTSHPEIALPPVLAPTGRTVLLIEDDEMIRELMVRFLRKEGFEVIESSNGQDGLRLARECHPDVITLDVMMPGMDGWTVLTKLKSNSATAEIPVIMLTIVDDRGRGFALGAADYLTKPVDWQRLGNILRKYLAAGKSDTVLVIDDNDDNRSVIRRAIEREGWKMIEAVDGEEGLKAFSESHPALILLDLMMPVLDGFGFLDELNRRYPGQHVPVVVLTAKELTTEDFQRLNGRVARIVAKGDPKKLEEMLQLIHQYIPKQKDDSHG